MLWKDFWLGHLNGPRLGDLEGFLVGNCDGEALRQSDGVLVGRSGKGYHSVHQTGPGSVNVWVRCLVGLVDGWMLSGVKTKVASSCAQRRSC